MTNLALLLATRPEARPERLVLTGGAIAEGNVTSAAEFNVCADPDSGFDGAPIHDAVAVAQVILPEPLELERLKVEIDCESSLCRGAAAASRTRTSWSASTPKRSSGSCSNASRR